MQRVLLLGASCGVLASCGSSDSIVGPDGAQCSRGTIALEQQQSGELTPADCRAHDAIWSRTDYFYRSYSIQLQQGRSYLVSLRSQEFDTMVELIGAGGARLAFADDIEDFGGFVDTDSELYFVAATSGVFSLRVRGYDEGELGMYSLSVRGCGGQRFTGTQSVQGTLSTARCSMREWFAAAESGEPTYAEMYVIPFQQGETKRVSMSSTAFTPAFEIGGPGFDFFDHAAAAVPPLGTQDLVADVTVGPAGDYLLIVGSREAQATGAYSLDVTIATATAAAVQPQLSRAAPLRAVPSRRHALAKIGRGVRAAP